MLNLMAAHSGAADLEIQELSDVEIAELLRRRSGPQVDLRLKIHQYVRGVAHQLVRRSSRPGRTHERRVYFYWHSGLDDAPPIVKACFRQLNRTSDPSSIVVITDENLSELVDLPPAVMMKVHPTNKTHFSNILRTALLSQSPGIWTDATCFHTQDLLGLFPTLAEGGFFAHSRTDARLMGTWFMMADSGAVIPRLVLAALEAFWTDYDALPDYFLFSLLIEAVHNTFPAFRAEWERTPNLSAHTAHELQFALPHTYDPERLDKLLQLCPIHKLTHKFDGPDHLSPGTIYQHLVHA